MRRPDQRWTHCNKKSRRVEAMGCKCTKFLSPTKVNPAEISVEPPVRIVSRNPVNQYNGYGKRPAKEPAVRSRSGVAVNVKHHQDEVPSTHVIHSMLTFERSDAKRRESIDSTLSEESPESNRSTSPSDSSSTDIGKEMSDRMQFVVHGYHLYRQTRSLGFWFKWSESGHRNRLSGWSVLSDGRKRCWLDR